MRIGLISRGGEEWDVGEWREGFRYNYAKSRGYFSVTSVKWGSCPETGTNSLISLSHKDGQAEPQATW